jgi:hypothetical protein
MSKVDRTILQPRRRNRALWRCPVCSRDFANRNQSHFCGRHSLDAHFDGRSPAVLALYRQFVALTKRFGPVRILPEKSRIAFQVRMSFAALMLRRSHIVGHLVLASRQPRSFFSRIDTISPRNHVHHFVLRRPEDLNGDFAHLVGTAYKVGEQKHLGGRL